MMKQTVAIQCTKRSNALKRRMTRPVLPCAIRTGPRTK